MTAAVNVGCFHVVSSAWTTSVIPPGIAVCVSCGPLSSSLVSSSCCWWVALSVKLAGAVVADGLVLACSRCSLFSASCSRLWTDSCTLCVAHTADTYWKPRRYVCRARSEGGDVILAVGAQSVRFVHGDSVARLSHRFHLRDGHDALLLRVHNWRCS